MANPLVAQAEDSTKAYSGISLLESANDLKSAIESGDWASVALGSIGTALDALSIAMDPFGAILAAGVGWLMEHVEPLKQALNGLAGNADEVAAQAKTWTNVATELGSIGADLTSMTASDTSSWTGASGDDYRQRVADTVALLGSAQKGCEGAASGVKTAGEVVAAVRALVRDIIAELIGHLISWALQVVFTLGIGLTWVVPQVINEVAKVGSKIADLTKRLVQAIKQLIPLLKKAGDLFSGAAKALRDIKPGKVAPPAKQGDIAPAPKNVDVGPGGNGSTTPSGAGGGGGPSGTGGDHGPKGGGDGGGSTTPSGAGGSPSGGGTPGGGTPGGGAPHDTPKGGPEGTPKGLDSPPGGGGSTTPSGSKGGPDTSPPPANKPGDPQGTSKGTGDRVCESDPVDVASGEMVLEQIDVSFPGPLGFVLERTHVSSYRAGRLFGASWASTVDQRLELDDENACYFAPDGMILVYPLPSASGERVMPVAGPRWPLSIDPETGAYVVNDLTGWRKLTFQRPADSLNGRTLSLAEIEKDGRSIRIAHDPDGLPLSWVHSDGYRVDLGLERGRVHRLSVVDATGGMVVQVAGFGYDERGRLTSVINSSGKPMRFDYDDDGRMTGWQDRTGSWYRYIYDAQGRCVRTVGDQGYLDGQFVYEQGRTRHTDSLGNTKTFELNALGQVVRETDPLGATTEFIHDEYNRLLSRTDPLGRTTSFTYNAFGGLTGVVRPDGSIVRVNLDATQPLLISIQDGERTWMREYAGEIGDGVPDPATEQIGVAAGFDYARLENQDDLAEAGEYRDLFGRPRVQTDVFGGQVRFEWTVEGLQASRIGRTGEREQWRYDAEGNEVEHVTATGGVERAEFGPFGLRTASVDSSGARTTYSYDTELRLASVTNPNGLTWTYRYDPLGRLVEERDFDGRVLRFTYDAAGQVVQTVNGLGETTDYTHDELGNVVRRQTPAGTTEYTYNPVGWLMRAANGDAVLEYERDDEGRVLRETINGQSVLFTYRKDGSVLTRRTPSGVESQWTLDPAGNPTALAFAGHDIRFDHDAAGRELGRTVGTAEGSVKLAQSFDAGDRITGQTVTTPAGILKQRRYEYRPDGSPTVVADTVAGTTRYGYDAAGRVVDVAAADHRETYRYDLAGHVVESTVAGRWPVGAESGAHRYAANTLTNAGIVGYRHDRQGRMVTRTVVDPVAGAQTWQFSWDPLDRMTGVVTPDGSRWRYLYEPLGRRIAKMRLAPDGSVIERVDFAWAGSQLVEQAHSNAQGQVQVLTWERHPEDDRPIAQAERTGEIHRLQVVVTDQTGTPTELVDPAAGIVWHGRSALWGKTVAPGGTPLRFPGQYADPETGLHYNVYRYYDPATGRYISQDPLGLAPAPDPAAYAPNPLVGVDPLGLTSQTISPCGKVGGGSGSGGKKRPASDLDAGALDQPPKKQKQKNVLYQDTVPNLKDVDPKSGRTVQQGGAQSHYEAGGHYGKGSSNTHVGNSPKADHLTDVNKLNDAKWLHPELDANGRPTGYNVNGLSDDLGAHLENNGMKVDEGWVKGHLENDNIGGPGEAPNMTALTDTANKAHVKNVESSIKDLIERQNGISFKQNGLDGVGVDYYVKVSDDVKFPNSPNDFERSIRDYIEIDAKYTGTSGLEDKLNKLYPPLGDLPPKGTRMDTITGKFEAPDGNGGWTEWKKNPKGARF